MKSGASFILLKKTGGWFLCFLGVVCFFTGIKIYGSVKENSSAAVFLSGTYPDKGQVSEVIEREKEAESPVDVCFFWNGGISTLWSEKYGTQKEAMVCGILGDATLYDGRIQGFSLEDREGCVIDEKTSYGLFGSRETVGSEVFLNGKTYVIRDVISWKQPLILIRPTDSKTFYTRAFVRLKQGETKKSAGDAFLLRNGFTGITIYGLAVKNIGFFLIFIPVLVFWFWIFCIAWRERKDFFWKGICVAMAGIFIFWLLQGMEIPKDWIPGKWSDFSFWSKKWKEDLEGLWMYLILPKTAAETDQIIQIFQIGFCSFDTLLLCLLGRRLIIRRAKINEGGL